MSEEKKEKKAPAKKATTAKKTTTKATAKKTAAKTTTKTAAKKPAATAKKTTAKATTKTAAKKTTTKAATKTTAKKTADKTTTKKATTKTTAKKTAAKTTKKTTAKKAPAKRATRAKKVEEVVADDAKLIKDLEMEKAIRNPMSVETPVEAPVETTMEVPVESTSTNEFGTTTVSAEVSKAYVQQPVFEATENVSQEEKKARKGGRKVIVTMVVVIILAIAAFLGLWYFSKITAHNKIVDTLDKLKSGDRDTAVELIDVSNTLGLDQTAEKNTTVEDLLIVNQETETTETTSVTNEIIQQSKKDEKDYIDFFKGMEYEIIEEKADFVDGYVKVRIVNKNIGKIIKKYYVRAFALSIKSAFSTQESSNVQKRLDDYLKELLTSDEIERVATDVTFKLKRDGFEWKLDVNKEELCDAILPGLREQLKDLDF